MNRIKKSALAAVAVMMLAGSLAFAQGPLQKRINYTINVPYSLKVGEYTLSPGRYVLYQVSSYDPNQFALYAGDMRHSPIAMIRTTRIQYQSTRYPSKTKMLLDIEDVGQSGQPIMRGWTIPGEDGWEIIAVVAKNDRYLTRVR